MNVRKIDKKNNGCRGWIRCDDIVTPVVGEEFTVNTGSKNGEPILITEKVTSIKLKESGCYFSTSNGEEYEITFGAIHWDCGH